MKKLAVVWLLPLVTWLVVKRTKSEKMVTVLLVAVVVLASADRFTSVQFEAGPLITHVAQLAGLVGQRHRLPGPCVTRKTGAGGLFSLFVSVLGVRRSESQEESISSHGAVRHSPQCSSRSAARRPLMRTPLGLT